MTYTYYVVGNDGVAHTIIELPEQVDLAANPLYVEAGSFDQSVLGSRRVGTTWEAPPSPWHRWSATASEWTVPEIELVEDSIQRGTRSAEDGAELIASIAKSISDYQADQAGGY